MLARTATLRYSAICFRALGCTRVRHPAISGIAQVVPAEQRNYVTAIGAASSVREKITIYTRAIMQIQHRMAPVFLALRDAASTDDYCARLQAEISERRAQNMLLFAVGLRNTGELRSNLTDQQIADMIWSMNAAEFWILLVHERSWTATAPWRLPSGRVPHTYPDARDRRPDRSFGAALRPCSPCWPAAGFML